MSTKNINRINLAKKILYTGLEEGKTQTCKTFTAGSAGLPEQLPPAPAGIPPDPSWWGGGDLKKAPSEVIWSESQVLHASDLGVGKAVPGHSLVCNTRAVI